MAAKAPAALTAMTTAHTSAASSTPSNPGTTQHGKHQQQQQPRGMLMDVVMSVFEPGTNSGLIRAMNYSFYSLFVTLLLMVYGTKGNVHVCALLVLSVGLFLSIKWFLIQVADVEEKLRIEREQEAARSASIESKGKGKTE